jgi:hypothetical protein
MYYEKAFSTLRRQRVRYLIAGGMAVNLHGVPRFTKDLGRASSPFEEIDILVDSPVPFDKAKKRCVTTKAGKLTLQLVSIPDLIRMKRKAAREQDLSDIEALERCRR